MKNEINHININKLAGKYIKKNRLKKGLTGVQLGKLLYISQQQISRYERGKNNISLSLIILFNNKIGLETEDFLAYISSEKENEINQ